MIQRGAAIEMLNGLATAVEQALATTKAAGRRKKSPLPAHL